MYYCPDQTHKSFYKWETIYIKKFRQEGLLLDANRARMIMKSSDSIKVFHEGSPVWIEKVIDDNSAEITFFGNNKKEIIPLRQLIENNQA
ncbi:MAG: small, acid-soluble spore protein, H family [Ruminiclostridium sp.]|nr:small, acid-soluble spore protein, H family [Ruminiclostridium sp.]